MQTSAEQPVTIARSQEVNVGWRRVALLLMSAGIFSVGCADEKAVVAAGLEAAGGTKTPQLDACRIERSSPGSTTLQCGNGWTFEVFASAASAPPPEDLLKMARERPGHNDNAFKIDEVTRKGQLWRVGRVHPASANEAVIDAAVVFATVRAVQPTVAGAVTCSGIMFGGGDVEPFCGPIVDALLSKTLASLGLRTVPPTLFGSEVKIHATAKVTARDERSWSVSDEAGGRLYVSHIASGVAKEPLVSWMDMQRKNAESLGQVAQAEKKLKCTIADRETMCHRLVTLDDAKARHVTAVAFLPGAGVGDQSGQDVFYHCSWTGAPMVPGNVCSGTLKF